MTAWLTPTAQSLLRTIIAERPECIAVHRFEWVSCRYPKYLGDNARQLRKLWQAKVDAAVEAGDRDALGELYGAHPDDLIQQAIEGSDGLLDLTVQSLGDGTYRVAA